MISIRGFFLINRQVKRVQLDRLIISICFDGRRIGCEQSVDVLESAAGHGHGEMKRQPQPTIGSLRITGETLQHEAHCGRRFLLFIGGDNIL